MLKIMSHCTWMIRFVPLPQSCYYTIRIYWWILDEAESEDDDSIVQGKKIKLAGNVPETDYGVKGSKRKSADLFCDVRVDLKKLLLYLSADHIIPKRTLANFVEGKLIHLFLIHDNICVQYLLPALVDWWIRFWWWNKEFFLWNAAEMSQNKLLIMNIRVNAHKYLGQK